MKKIIFLFAFALLFPLFSFASTDSITIDPIVISACGSQQVTISGTADYMIFLRKVTVRLDGQIIHDYHHNHANWNAGKHTLDVGTHEIVAQVRRLFFGGEVAEARQTVVVEECFPPVCEEGYTFDGTACVPIPVVDPSDVCSNIEGIQETVPEGMELIDGNCVVSTPPIECPEGQVLEGETCVPVEPPVVCEEGYVLEGNTCVIEPLVCEEGYSAVDGSCVADTVTPPITQPVASAGSSSRSSGHMHPCSYIAAFSDMPCPYTEELRMKFVTDSTFRELILSIWRAVVFGGVKLK